MKKIVEMAHQLLEEHVGEHSIAVDFTMGQGNDLLFLAQLSDVKIVHGFDIQEEAVKMSEEKLKTAGLLEKAKLHLVGHEHCDAFLDGYDIGIFNFGYLPHGDETITTMLDTSKLAVAKALKLLHKHGLLVLVVYPGHEQGQKESAYFNSWCEELDGHCFNVLQMRMVNHKQAPYILAIQRIREEKKK